MHFLNTLLLAACTLASLVAAENKVTFVNQDSTKRTIYFTPSIGCAEVKRLVVDGDSQGTATFPEAWIGNFYAVSEGAELTTGVIGEVTFQGWDGYTYFDVSTIVDAIENFDGVKELFPANKNTPMSGCQEYPCDNAYNQPDDIMTESTEETELICLIGTLSSSRKRGAVSERKTHEFVMGKRDV